MKCAQCKHALPAPRYPADTRHCPLAAAHYRLPVPAWAGSSCPPELAKWEPKG